MKCRFYEIGDKCEGKLYAKWNITISTPTYSFTVLYCKEHHLLMMKLILAAKPGDVVQYRFMYLLHERIPWQPDMLQYEEKPTDPVEA